MKKIGLLVLSAAFILGGCEKKEDTKTDTSSYPTDGLTVDEKQRVLLLEHTGAWCQYCPNGAVIMTEMVAKYGKSLIPIANHNGDALATPATSVLANNFPDAGFPSFYVMNNEVGQAPEADILAEMAKAPFMGVTHTVISTDTSWNVYPKLEVYEASFNEDYLIQSYLMLDNVLAKDYGGGIDLNQVSSVAVAGGTNPTKWLQNAAVVNGEPQIKAGSDYYHQENLILSAKTTNPYGIAIADANPFGTEYIEGDILGTKNTPILLSIPKVSISPFDSGLSVVTIVWRLRTDGSGAFDFVNGYMSHHVTP